MIKERFPIVPAGGGPVITFGIIATVLLGALFPAASAPAAVFIIILLVVVAALSFLGSFVYASRRVEFQVSPEGLAIRGDIYGRRLPAASLLTDEAEIINLAESRNLRPAMRINGAGFPGYGSGWFRLNNGGKALIFVTDRHRVAYVPTGEGYVLLLSVTEPEKFLAALKRIKHT